MGAVSNHLLYVQELIETRIQAVGCIIPGTKKMNCLSRFVFGIMGKILICLCECIPLSLSLVHQWSVHSHLKWWMEGWSLFKLTGGDLQIAAGLTLSGITHPLPSLSLTLCLKHAALHQLYERWLTLVLSVLPQFHKWCHHSKNTHTASFS